MCRKKKTHKASVTAKEKMSIKKGYCQEWGSNPCPFGPVPETGALDQLGHLDNMPSFDTSFINTM